MEDLESVILCRLGDVIPSDKTSILMENVISAIDSVLTPLPQGTHWEWKQGAVWVIEKPNIKVRLSKLTAREYKIEIHFKTSVSRAVWEIKDLSLRVSCTVSTNDDAERLAKIFLAKTEID